MASVASSYRTVIPQRSLGPRAKGPEGSARGYLSLTIFPIDTARAFLYSIYFLGDTYPGQWYDIVHHAKFEYNESKYNESTLGAFPTTESRPGRANSHKPQTTIYVKARRTADGVNPKSRRVREKSDEENCFL